MDNAEDELDWFWICYGCGVDVPHQPEGRVDRKGYDEYWSKEEDTQASLELDNYFYDSYPEFKS